MKQRLQQLISALQITPGADPAFHEFGLRKGKHYDVLVVAPGWKPTEIVQRKDVHVACTMERSYVSGYELTAYGRSIAWIQCSPGASSMVDELSTCAELDIDKLVFVGAVGSLTADIGLGELCTPEWCIAGNLANGYLEEDLRKYVPFQRVYPNAPSFVDRVEELARAMGRPMRRTPVFCTDSIFCEYSHMDFIKSFGAKLIEMETSTFYRLAELMEKPAVALLVVSDNSATGDPLLARTPEQKVHYDQCRKEVIPELVLKIAELPL